MHVRAWCRDLYIAYLDKPNQFMYIVLLSVSLLLHSVFFYCFDSVCQTMRM